MRKPCILPPEFGRGPALELGSAGGKYVPDAVETQLVTTQPCSESELSSLRREVEQLRALLGPARAPLGTLDDHRAARLVALNTALSAALTSLEVAEAVVVQGSALLGASMGMVGVLSRDRQQVEVIATRGYSDEVVARFRHIPVTAPIPISDAIRLRESILLGSLGARMARYPHLRSTQASIGFGAMATLPLIVENRAIGGIGFHFADERAFSPDERALMGMLASQCAQALERARLFDRERRARNETTLLYTLTAAVSRAETIDQVYEPALSAMQRALRVDRAAILLFERDGAMRFVASRGLSEGYRQQIEAGSLWPMDTNDPSPCFVREVALEPRLEAHRELLKRERVEALGMIPLFHRKLLGRFMIYSGEPRRFSDHEMRLAEAVAAHVAHAVTRQRAHEEISRAYVHAEAARRCAETAASNREKLLAVVSHDLKNPLSAISMCANRIATADGDQRWQAQLIERSATWMDRLIDDLLDFASIDAGTLTVERRSIRVGTVLDEGAELLSLMAMEKNQQLIVNTVCPATTLVSADLDRLLQVVSNLLGNAIKFTPAGGIIRLSARLADDCVEFSVADTGAGMDESELPRVFEPYWQGRGGRRQGVGLGLSIARGIVEAHGGRIWAESTLGLGTTVRFTVPVQSPAALYEPTPEFAAAYEAAEEWLE